MSTRHTRSLFGVLLVMVFAFSAIVAAPASAKLTKHQKSHIRKQLRKQIRHNPKMIRNKRFVHRAALVNFKLPVTLRLRGGNTPGTCNGLVSTTCQPTPGIVPGSSNPNKASVDLGASLGSREVDLGGKLAAEITFRDSFDGGALGNVDLTILPSATKALTSTSIPLLWNTQVTQALSRFDANDLYLDGIGLAPSGCANFTGTNVPFGANITPGPAPFGGIPQPSGLVGYPVSPTPGGPVQGFLPITPGIDDVVTGPLSAGTQPGNNDIVGGNPNPFPAGGPSGYSGPGNPTVKDTVLRTNALSLTIATPGTAVNQTDSSPNGPNGSQNIVIGKSGGQANLFGNIPGKSYGIDVTVSLATRINSILRVVDQDSFHTGLYSGQNWPAGVFNCRQIWTGGLQNYIPDVRLTGNLKIAPGLTSDGHLRIAKATVASAAGDTTRFAVAACLFPHTTYTARQGNNTVPDPVGTGYAGVLANPSQLPVNTAAQEPVPAANCDSAPDSLVANSALPPSTVGVLGSNIAPDGSRVTVAADLNVQNVAIDVLIGDV